LALPAKCGKPGNPPVADEVEGFAIASSGSKDANAAVPKPRPV
jgi:hypothetical protein